MLKLARPSQSCRELQWCTILNHSCRKLSGTMSKQTWPKLSHSHEALLGKHHFKQNYHTLNSSELFCCSRCCNEWILASGKFWNCYHCNFLGQWHLEEGSLSSLHDVQNKMPDLYTRSVKLSPRHLGFTRKSLHFWLERSEKYQPW